MDQIDLFSPNEMNITMPNCFESIEQYRQWLELGRSAKEACTICGDCTYDYQVSMKATGRCDHEKYSTQIFFAKKIVPRKPRVTNVVLLDETPLARSFNDWKKNEIRN